VAHAHDSSRQGGGQRPGGQTAGSSEQAAGASLLQGRPTRVAMRGECEKPETKSSSATGLAPAFSVPNCNLVHWGSCSRNPYRLGLVKSGLAGNTWRKAPAVSVTSAMLVVAIKLSGVHSRKVLPCLEQARLGFDKALFPRMEQGSHQLISKLRKQNLHNCYGNGTSFLAAVRNGQRGAQGGQLFRGARFRARWTTQQALWPPPPLTFQGRVGAQPLTATSLFLP